MLLYTLPPVLFFRFVIFSNTCFTHSSILSFVTFCLCPSICVSALALVPLLSLPSALRSPPPPPPPSPLQACKPNHSAEGGGSGQSLPPHVGSLGQAEDQSCPAKRRRASSPSKVSTAVTASFLYPRLSNSTDEFLSALSTLFTLHVVYIFNLYYVFLG